MSEIDQPNVSAAQSKTVPKGILKRPVVHPSTSPTEVEGPNKLPNVCQPTVEFKSTDAAVKQSKMVPKSILKRPKEVVESNLACDDSTHMTQLTSDSNMPAPTTQPKVVMKSILKRPAADLQSAASQEDKNLNKPQKSMYYESTTVETINTSAAPAVKAVTKSILKRPAAMSQKHPENEEGCQQKKLSNDQLQTAEPEKAGIRKVVGSKQPIYHSIFNKATGGNLAKMKESVGDASAPSDATCYSATTMSSSAISTFNQDRPKVKFNPFSPQVKSVQPSTTTTCNEFDAASTVDSSTKIIGKSQMARESMVGSMDDSNLRKLFDSRMQQETMSSTTSDGISSIASTEMTNSTGDQSTVSAVSSTATDKDTRRWSPGEPDTVMANLVKIPAQTPRQNLQPKPQNTEFSGSCGSDIGAQKQPRVETLQEPLDEKEEKVRREKKKAELKEKFNAGVADPNLRKQFNLLLKQKDLNEVIDQLPQ